MEGIYQPFCDDYGIVGWHYKCPKCNHITKFVYEPSCGNVQCNFEEEYVDADDWYNEEMSKPEKERAWNKTVL